MKGGTIMKKSFFIHITIVLAIAAMILALHPKEAASQAKYNLKLQTSWPAGTDLFDTVKYFADQVEKMSAGRLTVEVTSAGAIVSAYEVLDATAKGVLDASHTAPGYWAGKNMAAALFGAAPGGPYGFDLMDYWGWLYAGGGLELYQEVYQDALKRNVVVFPMVMLAPQILGWFKNPIKDWEDLKGRKCRFGALTGDCFRTGGVSVVAVPGGEILPAAERGIVECAEFSGPAMDMKLGIHQVFKYMYMPGATETTVTCELLINGDVWKKLPADLKEIVKIATQAVTLQEYTRYIKLNALAMKEAKEKYGVKLMRTPDDVLRNLLQAWEKIKEEESAKNPLFKKILESQKEYANLVVPARRLYYPTYGLMADYYWPQ
jgi:TRAP-type mannitol/chloroaromatic compound transport system substrate-binding protein